MVLAFDWALLQKSWNIYSGLLALSGVSTIPLSPFLARKGKEEENGGYPRSPPAKGQSPSALPKT